MSSAKQEFLVRIDTLLECLKEASLNDGAPTEHVRNQVAGMIRQGLAVLTFAAFESFVRERTAECIKGFDPDVVAFSDLSDAIQEAATIGATRGLLYRFKFEDPTSRHTWALNQLKDIAASDTSLNKMSSLSFGSDKANLDEDDIQGILKSFGVDQPWPNITNVAKLAGMGGLLDAKAQFTRVKQLRHASAHQVTSTVPHGDLVSSIQTIRALALGFDMLLSHAVSVHNLGRIPGKKPEPKVDASHIKLLFVAESPSPPDSFETYRIQVATSISPAIKVIVSKFSSKFEGITYAVEEANKKHEQIIDVGSGGLILDWHTWE
jgi:RiboL-PSP-HEPN